MLPELDQPMVLDRLPRPQRCGVSLPHAKSSRGHQSDRRRQRAGAGGSRGTALPVVAYSSPRSARLTGPTPAVQSPPTGTASGLSSIEQRQRVAVRFGDHTVHDPIIEPIGEHGGQQLPGIRSAETGDHKLWKPTNLLRQPARGRRRPRQLRLWIHAGGEGNRMGRGGIEPLCVIHRRTQPDAGCSTPTRD